MKAEFFNGMQIVSHPLATITRWRVARHPTPKRRRRWSVERYQEPSAFRVPGILYVHPDLYERLLAQLR